MKKHILTLMLAFIVSATFAQSTTKQPETKQTTPAKKDFSPDYNKSYSITIKLPGYIFSQYFYSLQNPGFEASDLKGKDIQSIKSSTATVIDSIYRSYQKIIQADYAKFVADTTTKKQPIKKQ